MLVTSGNRKKWPRLITHGFFFFFFFSIKMPRSQFCAVKNFKELVAYSSITHPPATVSTLPLVFSLYLANERQPYSEPDVRLLENEHKLVYFKPTGSFICKGLELISIIPL